MFWMLTPAGQAETIWYRIRRCFVPPAPSEDRCYMGAPIHPMVHCPRKAEGDGLWCRAHRVKPVKAS